MDNKQRGFGALVLLGAALVGFWFAYGQQLWDDYRQDQVLGQLESVVEQTDSDVDEAESTTTTGIDVEAEDASSTSSTEATTTTSEDDQDEEAEDGEETEDDDENGSTTTATTEAESADPDASDRNTPEPENSDSTTSTTERATTTTTEAPGPARAASFDVVEMLNHDTNAFTQGLEISDGRLFESTGIIGESTIRELDLATGDVIRTTQVPEVFAEGLTIVGDTAIQLTWQSQIAYRYELDTFEVIETYDYDGEGWGLCNATEGSGNLVMSDGSSLLEFRDPDTFESVGSVEVLFDGAPVENLNELECVGDTVWANIWLTDLIIEIDPNTGAVITVIDAAELRPDTTTNSTGAVLNGLAYDATTDTMLVTGKLWPIIYRLDIN